MRTKMYLATLAMKAKKVLCTKHQGMDAILVTVGLCIVALLLCVIMKDSLSAFITTIIGNLTTKAQGILGI